MCKEQERVAAIVGCEAYNYDGSCAQCAGELVEPGCTACTGAGNALIIDITPL